jgi:glycine/D-amino acid oxidase-like deaminating enzyme
MFGTDAEVLSPPELRQNLARKAAQAAAAYAAPATERGRHRRRARPPRVRTANDSAVHR